MLISKTVPMRWNSVNKKWYESKGYIYTKMGDEFEVKVEDLTEGSNVKVNVKCDCEYCKNPFLKPVTWYNYKKCVKEDGKYYCNKCSANDPMKKDIFNIGYIGIGDYKVKDKNNNKYPMYATWYNMFQRCYNKESQLKRPSYIGCLVCNEWLNYQNFAKWYDDNFYKINDELICLDKDILIKGNKTYSPETCIFTPNRINTLFIKNNIHRGKLPIGVSLHKMTNKYQATCGNKNNKTIYLGLYNTYEEAFNAYKVFKENLIKEVADEYKNVIPYKLYKAMYSYQIEIDD